MTDFVRRDGALLTPYMNYQIGRLAAEFKKRWGVTLKVRSGIRLHQEQIDIFLKRYVTAANIRGRRVYDTRVWKGVRYYRISDAGTVAAPGSSNHEIQGTKAAVDFYDTGSDAGVTVAGSARSNWLRANAPRFGLVASGFGFGEAWHYDVLNIFNKVPGSGSSSSPVSQDVKNQQSWLNRARGEKLKVDGIRGPATIAATKRYQTFLKSKHGYKGAIDGIWGKATQASHQKYYDAFNKKPAPKPWNPFGIKSVKGLQKVAKLHGYKGDIDDVWGDGSAAGFAEFLRKYYGYKGNDTLGPVMWKAIARWLRAKHKYRGNDIPGPVMRAALSRANLANFQQL